MDKLSYPWLRKVPGINCTFTIQDFRQAAKRANVGKIIFMECGTTSMGLEEAKLVEKLSVDEPRIKGIVANIDLKKGLGVIAELEELSTIKLVKGIRCGFA